MKYLLLSLLLLISTDPREIAKINSLKKEAEKAFLAGDYKRAVATYRVLDSLQVEDPALKLNLAHSLYQLKDTASAKGAYQAATTVANKRLKSIAYQQLGVLDRMANKLEESLQNLKSSIKADPTNEGARYDYELVKKLLEEQKKKEQEQKDQNKENQDQNKDQDKKDQEQNDDQNKDGEKSDEQKEQEKKEQEDQKKEGEKEEGENEEGEEQESDKEPTPEEQMREKLKEMNISEEKAKMILEALRNNEIQYLQQQKRKATKRPPSGKPDW